MHPDHHVQVAYALYSAPTQYCGKRLRVREQGEHVGQSAVDRFKYDAYDLIIDGESYRSRLKPDIAKDGPPLRLRS